MRRRDRETLAALFAAAHDARGRETSVGAGVVAVRDPHSGRERRVAVARRPGEVGDVDAVLTPYPDRFPDGGDPDVLGPADLRDLLRYALDREDGERLAEEFLGLSLSAPTSSPGPSRPVWLAPALVVVAVVAAAGLAVAVGPLWTDDAGGPTPTATFTFASSTPTPAAETTAVDDAYPTGLSRSEVTDAAALADRHERLLAGAVYAVRVEFDGTRSVEGEVYDGATLTADVENESVYRSRFVGARRSDRDGERFDTRRYADATAEYVRTGGTVERRSLPNGGEASPFDARTATFVERYLGGTNTSVRTIYLSGERFYRVVVGGAPSQLGSPAPLGSGDEAFDPPFASATNYTAVAYVRPSGLVSRLAVDYERADGEEVSFVMSFRVGTGVAADPPPWYTDYVDGATNGTDAPTTTTGASPATTSAPTATRTANETSGRTTADVAVPARLPVSAAG
jgi:hypothetical protein